MRIIDRLQQYLSHKKITPYSFEKKCKVANGYLNKQQKGKGSIGSDILERIHQNFFDLNLMWLITGEGEMLEETEETYHILRESNQLYTKDEQIKFLAERVAMLENSLADKQKIIQLLETNKK